MTPAYGAIRVNDTDYDGRVVVEQYDRWSGREGWGVPAWDERGEPDLEGPFASAAGAQAVVDAAAGAWL